VKLAASRLINSWSWLGYHVHKQVFCVRAE
jgi:hypothetical protein